MRRIVTDTDYQKRVLSLCEELLDLPAAQRRQELENREEIDKKLRNSVLAMLGKVDQNEAKSTRSPLSFFGHQAPVTGDDVAGWRLEEELGNGGMGVVYRARRSDRKSKQQVALKLLRAQIVTQPMRTRFDVERDILARLNHPYLATLVDGGTTDEGIPWIAMELVEGVRIDYYCDSERLTVNERLALLEKVASALQHAHQNLVIHRDIKPSNILVTRDGIPKLVDFGIAKFLSEPNRNEASSSTGPVVQTTQFGGQALTPDYASPEQILRGDISTASDIYSLGIVGLELVTGVSPYEIGDATPEELVRFMEGSTVPQSATLIQRVKDQDALQKLALERGTTVRRLRKQLGGDLAVVLAKATHREAQRRYGSAQGLAADLDAIRHSKPVSARKDSLTYRALSLIRANRLAVSVAGATVAALSVGLVAALWQAHMANERFTDLHEFARAVIGDVYDEVSDLPGSIAARRRITAEAQHYLDRLAVLKLDDAQLIGDLSLAFRRLADVQGWPSNPNLGQTEKALVNYRRASELSDRLDEATPQDLRQRATIMRRIADVLAWQGHPDEALKELKQSQAVFEQLLDLDPASATALVDLGYNLINLGDKSGHPSFQNIGDTVAAREYYQLAIDLLAPNISDKSERELERCYAVALERAGTMALQADDLFLARTFYSRSRDIREELAENHPDHSNIQRDAGIASESLAKVYRRQGNLNAATIAFNNALMVYQRLANIDSENANAQRTVAIGMKNLADTLRLQNEVTTARELYSHARETLRLLLEKDPTSKRLAAELTEIDARLASVREPDRT